jgi:hypothetical protein
MTRLNPSHRPIPRLDHQNSNGCRGFTLRHSLSPSPGQAGDAPAGRDLLNTLLASPSGCDKAAYRRRNDIERLFRRLNGLLRIFSRFDKFDVAEKTGTKDRDTPDVSPRFRSEMLFRTMRCA